MTRQTFLLSASLLLAACGSDTVEPEADVEIDVSGDAADDTAGDTTESDAASDTSEPEADAGESDAVEADAEDDTTEPDAVVDAEDDTPSDVAQDTEADTDADIPEDAGPVVCTTARVEGEWQVEISDDVSIGYKIDIAASPETFARELIILFERYNPFPDIGIFDLSEGADSNFGTCAHCVFVRGSSAIQALYVEEGTLDIRRDPYDRALDLTASGLRLVQVDVDLETRASTPVPGGACLVLGDFEADASFPADGWSCDAELYNNGVSCECECGAFDPDCAVGGECPPFDPGCEEVPRLPISDCTEAEICGFDPEAFAPACQETCSWTDRTACNTGICTPSTGVSDQDLCIESDALIHPAQIGEFCDASTPYQQFCNVVDGFALGYCDYGYECRPICSADEECTDEGDSCQFFLSPGEGLGFCGTIPEDG